MCKILHLRKILIASQVQNRAMEAVYVHNCAKTLAIDNIAQKKSAFVHNRAMKICCVSINAIKIAFCPTRAIKAFYVCSCAKKSSCLYHLARKFPLSSIVQQELPVF